MPYFRGSQPGCSHHQGFRFLYSHALLIVQSVQSSCANCSAQSLFNYSMPSARPSIQPETMLTSKKKDNTCNFSRIGPHLYEFITCLNILGVRKHIKIFYGCGPLQRLGTIALFESDNNSWVFGWPRSYQCYT